MIVAATLIDPPEGDLCWLFHLINDSDQVIESVVVESVSYEWGDSGNTERVGNRFGPIAPGASREILKETDTEVRTSLTLRVRGPAGEQRFLAEFGRLYRKPGQQVPIPILNRPGKLATLEALAIADPPPVPRGGPAGAGPESLSPVRAILGRLDELRRLRFKMRVVEHAIRLLAPFLPPEKDENGERGGTRMAERWLREPTRENAVSAGVAMMADRWDGGVYYHDYSIIFQGPANVAAAETAEEAALVALGFAIDLARYRRDGRYYRSLPAKSAEVAAAEREALAFQLGLAQQLEGGR